MCKHVASVLILVFILEEFRNYHAGIMGDSWAVMPVLMSVLITSPHVNCSGAMHCGIVHGVMLGRNCALWNCAWWHVSKEGDTALDVKGVCGGTGIGIWTVYLVCPLYVFIFLNKVFSLNL